MSALLKKALAVAVLIVATIAAVYAAMVTGTLLFFPVGDKSTIVGSFVFGLAAVATAFWAVRKYGWTRAWAAQLLVLVLALVVLTSSGFSSSSKGEGFSGGVTWNQDVDQNLGYASVPGHEMVDVWHRGHYPLGGFTNYRLHLVVKWGTQHSGYLTFDSRPTAQASVTDERFVDYNPADLKNITTKVYGCSVHGHWRAHGCFYAYIKVKMTVKMPTPGVNDLTIWPWVMVRVNSAGAVVVWDSSNSIA